VVDPLPADDFTMKFRLFISIPEQKIGSVPEAFLISTASFSFSVYRQPAPKVLGKLSQVRFRKDVRPY
jgi:hypothetical protein